MTDTNTDVFSVETVEDDAATKQGQRQLVWFLSIGFIVINTAVIFMGVLDSEYAANILSISDILFWFDLALAGVIGSYFSIDMIGAFTSLRNVRLVKAD